MVAILSLATTFFLTAVAVNAQVPANIPASCSSNCKAVSDKLASTSNGQPCAADFNCLCSTDVVKGLADCYKCAGGAIDQKAMTDALNLYADGCKTAGHPVDTSSITSGGNGGKSGDASSLQMSSFAAAVALGGLVLL
ncbi:hypothetical protein BJ165DRAFT_1408346 [Panaeolus papilionaceus]|nr:hypothetical protein BJ165DRAFT_1408346 [Panaeolus papilionaceus]